MEEPLTLGLLLLPIVAGYFLIKCSRRWRFYFSELEGHALFFASAVAGAFLLIMSRLVVVGAIGLRWEFVANARSAVHNIIPIPYSGTLLIAFSSGVAIGLLSNIGVSRTDALQKAARHSDGLMDFLLENIKARKSIALNLNGAEILIGYVIGLYKGRANPYIRFYPMMRARRDRHGLSVEFSYTENIDLLERVSHPHRVTGEDEELLKALELVLKRSEILSAEIATTILARIDEQTPVTEPLPLVELVQLAVRRWLTSLIR